MNAAHTPERDEEYVAYADTLPTYVAFSEALSLVKIGYSTNVRQRLGSLITDRPNAKRLELVGWAFGGPRLETELHERFAHAHEKGEWFHPVPEMADFIEEEGEEGEPPVFANGPFRVNTKGYWSARRRLAGATRVERVVWDFGGDRALRATSLVNHLDIEALIAGEPSKAAS